MQEKAEYMRKRDKKTRVIVLIIAVLLVIALVLPLLAGAIKAESPETEEETAALTANEVTGESPDQASADPGPQTEPSCGVFVENIDTTGMSLAEIEEAVAAKFQEYANDSIILYTDTGEHAVPASELGLTCTNTDIAREAYSIGRSGNVYKRFLAEHTLQKEPIILDLEMQVQEEAVHIAVEEAKKKLDRAPVPTGLTRDEDRKFAIKEKVDGVTVNAQATEAALVTYMNNVWHGGQGGLGTEYTVDPAEDRTESLKEVGDLLGTYETQYDVNVEGRKINIELATSHIDGQILFPGEEFSFDDVVGPQNAETGFALGGAFENGSIVEEYGGGVCQVSSTLYMAALYSELEITERYPHTMTVTYVSPGMDAAISDSGFNFRFKNPLNYPIYIEGIASDGKLTMSIYGKETREAGRTLAFESREISRQERTNVFYTKADLAYGMINVEDGRDGQQVELWKQIYKDGTMQSEEKVNTSNYLVYPDRFEIGIEGATAEQLNRIHTAMATGEVTQVYAAVSGF